MKQGRRHHTATLLEDGRVLLAGGCTHAGGETKCPSNTAEVFDPVRNKWTSTGNLKAPRLFHTASLLGDGKVLVAGGCSTPLERQDCPAQKTAELYDPATGKWSKTGNLISAQSGHAAAVVPGKPSNSCGRSCGKVLVVGSVGVPSEMYDPRRRTWSPVEGDYVPHSGFTATTLKNGGILVIGSKSGFFNPRTARLDLLAEQPVIPRIWHSATALQDGSVLVAAGIPQEEGGTVTSNAWGQLPTEAAIETSLTKLSDSTELFTPNGGVKDGPPNNGAWRPAPDLTERRIFHSATLMKDGRVLAVGGLGIGGRVPEPEVLNPEDLHWTETSNTVTSHGPIPFTFPLEHPFTATALKDGRVLVAGGLKGDRLQNAPHDEAEVFVPAGFQPEIVQGEPKAKPSVDSKTPAGAGIFESPLLLLAIGLPLLGGAMAGMMFRRRRADAAKEVSGS